jgi:hypothetical protein
VVLCAGGPGGLVVSAHHDGITSFILELPWRAS